MPALQFLLMAACWRFVTKSSGGTKLWIRPLNSVAARELPGTDDATFPFWSPDSRSLGFFAAGKLKRIEVAGGMPTVICDVGLGRGGTWNEEGVILFNAVNNTPLLRVSATGGKPVPFTTVDKAQGRTPTGGRNSSPEDDVFFTSSEVKIRVSTWDRWIGRRRRYGC